MQREAKLRAAFAWSERGVPSFPCRPGSKPPLTQHGYKDASADPECLRRWWSQWPEANVGIPTGVRSGFVVFDIDVKNGRDGFATLAELEHDLGELPPTTTARTPNGGEHRYFRAPLDGSARSSSGKLAGEDAPGFDVRGEGGYVLVPPSVVGGVPYRWTSRDAPQELPERWLAALVPPARSTPSEICWEPQSTHDADRTRAWCLRALQSEARELAATAEGARNDRLWRAAAALGGLIHTGGTDATEVRRALQWACSTWRTRSPRKDTDTLERGLAFGRANPRQINLGERDAA